MKYLQYIFILPFLSVCLLAIGQNREDDPGWLRKMITQHPKDIQLQREYIKVMGTRNLVMKIQFDKWIKMFPDQVSFPMTLGEAYMKKELPDAEPYLLKALKIEPDNAKLNGDLAADEQRWGRFDKARSYLKRASELDPGNSAFAFDYAYSMLDSDFANYKKLSLSVAERWPETEKGAQSLYFLAQNSRERKDMTETFELLKDKFDPNRFDWSKAGMTDYIELLYASSPDSALKLSQSLFDKDTTQGNRLTWSGLIRSAASIKSADSLITAGEPQKALPIIDSIKLANFSRAWPLIRLLHAKALDAAGLTAQAYEYLLRDYADFPDNALYPAIKGYAGKLQKSEQQVDVDTWRIRDTAAKAATPFRLKQYLKPGYLSLSDLKGKVVLLTYWFPGCGPCRAEFPYFQQVVNKFSSEDLAYIGINIAAAQNDYVVPFLQSSKYTFTPIEEEQGRVKGNLQNNNAAPVNFLIDQDGRIVCKDFRTDGRNESELENMISYLVKRGHGSITGHAIYPGNAPLKTADGQKQEIKADTDTAVDFVTNSLNGHPIKLTDYREKYVLLYFPTARVIGAPDDNMQIGEFRDNYHEKGLEVIELTRDLSRESRLKVHPKDPWVKGSRFIRQYKNGKYVYSTDISRLYAIGNYPAVVLIDPFGKIIGRYSKSNIDQLVSKLGRIMY